MLRRELQGMRMESAQLRGELSSSSSHPSQPAPSAPAAQSTTYPSDPYTNGNRTELPPLRSISNSIPNAPESMTGVQYEAARTNGYRPERY